jgi:hypothetical protein
MREFTKNVLSFSSAMSLFAVKQVASLLNPDTWTRRDSPAANAFDHVTQCTVEELGRTLAGTFEAGDRLQRQFIDVLFGAVSAVPCPGTGGGSPMPALAIFDELTPAGERIMISYTRGQGRFSDDKRFITLNNTIYTLESS